MSRSGYSSFSIDPIGQTGPKSRPHKCSDCGHTYTRQSPHSSALKARHRRGHSDKRLSKCPTCSIRTVSKGCVFHTHNRTDVHPHSCTLCDKAFISSTHLALHMHSHSGDRKYKCGICGKLFRQPAHLMRHKSIHIGDKPFKCPECGKCFGRASHLKTHRRIHTGEKPFKCSVCDRAFTQKAGLVMHYRLHTRERPFKCDPCGESFRTSTHLLSHQARQCFSCGQCRKTFKSVSELRRHQNTHICPVPEDLKCGVCCRSFVRSSYVRLCVRLNSGQRPYHCKVCNKTFAKMATFERHCEKHLRQSRGNDEEVEEDEEEGKLPFSSLLPSPPSSASPPSLPLPTEITPRSKTRARVE